MQYKIFCSKTTPSRPQLLLSGMCWVCLYEHCCFKTKNLSPRSYYVSVILQYYGSDLNWYLATSFPVLQMESWLAGNTTYVGYREVFFYLFVFFFSSCKLSFFASLYRPLLTPYSMAFETKLILQKLVEKCWQNMYLDRRHPKQYGKSSFLCFQVGVWKCSQFG